MTRLTRHLVQDAAIVAVSIAVAILLVRTGTIDHAISALHRFSIFGIIIAGMFFTSIFTTAPAIAALGELSLVYHPVVVAFLGAAGAILGDLVIFRFVKDRFSSDLSELLATRTSGDRIKKLMHMKFFRWFFFLIGGIIIASPLPDELGISMLGASQMKTRWFLLVAFIFNFIGILAIGFLASSIK